MSLRSVLDPILAHMKAFCRRMIDLIRNSPETAGLLDRDVLPKDLREEVNAFYHEFRAIILALDATLVAFCAKNRLVTVELRRIGITSIEDSARGLWSSMNNIHPETIRVTEAAVEDLWRIGLVVGNIEFEQATCEHYLNQHLDMIKTALGPSHAHMIG